jgi:hypothetical protein
MPLLRHTLNGLLAPVRHVVWYVNFACGGAARERAQA